MRKPIGVYFAAGVLAIMTCFGLLIGFSMIFMGIFFHPPAATVAPLPAMVRTMQVAMGVLFLAFCVFCGTTVVGLFQFRRWARYAMIAIGALTAGFFVLLSGTMFLARNFAPAQQGPQLASSVNMNAIFIMIAAFYGVVALIGIWWVIYFNLRHVRLAFSPTAGENLVSAIEEGTVSAAWRTMLIVVACLLLLGGISMLGMLWLRPPLFLFGHIVRGYGSLIFLLLMGAASLYAGIGLIRKSRGAYWTAIGLQLYMLVTAVLFCIPSYALRAFSLSAEINRRWMPNASEAATSASQMMAPFIGIVMLIYTALLLLVLICCRKLFFPPPSAV